MSDIAKRLSAAMSAFNKIGVSNGSAPPVTKSNTAPLVYEAFMAQKLAKAASERKDRAMKALYDASVLDDDYKPGDYTPYASDGLAVTVKRNNDSDTLDKTMLKNWLSKKYGPAVADEAIRESSKPRKGNTTITVSMM